MSALGQKQTYAAQQVMSALPPIATAKADIGSSRPCMNPRLKGARGKLLATLARTLEAGTCRTYIDRSRG
jgi:hypothetical protein